MQTQFELKGYFSVPNNPEEELPGILSFSQANGINLELFGNFKTFSSPSSRESNIILGLTSKGKKITLLNCFEYSRSFGFPGFPQSSISAIYLFIGEHFKLVDELKFSSMRIGYDDINFWLDISGFEKPAYNEKKDEVVIKYTKPEDLKYEIGDGWHLSMEFSFFGPSNYFPPIAGTEIKQVTDIVFTNNLSEGHFFDFQKHLQTVNSFLAICYYAFPKLHSLVFHKKNQLIEEGENTYNEVELLFKHGVDYGKYKEHRYESDFLITYHELKYEFEAIAKKWFELKKEIDATIDILTDCFMNRKTQMEYHFLGLSQAIENMHRRLLRNDVSFQKRLETMISNLPPKIATSLLSTEINFAERVRQNRNYYTHYSERLDSKAASLSELFVMSEKLKIILIVNLLIETGVGAEKVQDLIINKSVFLFNHIIKYSKEVDETDDDQRTEP